ncbi:MAG: hypothetical protein IPM39_25345 [Chloroflexi bacterium]|nr:hypothetical protein [Chloroflexota bacterium]
MTTNTRTNVPLGYIFHPGPSHFGSAGFDAILTTKPTQQHFDPDYLHVTAGAARGTQRLEIHHPWRLADHYAVCAGRILLSDRFKKCVEVFTFGGQLTIVTSEEQTLCTFASAAPFLDLVTSHSVTTLFTNEVEILLAQRRAARNLHVSGEFDAILLRLDPLLLYVSCLAEIRQKFKLYPAHDDQVVQRFKYRIEQEIGRLQQEGLWPAHIPKPAEII